MISFKVDQISIGKVGRYSRLLLLASAQLCNFHDSATSGRVNFHFQHVAEFLTEGRYQCYFGIV